MANCHKNFFTANNSFHSKITLDDPKREALTTSRKGLRQHIKAKFAERNRPQIKFQIQGSFAMGTTVNPLDGDYDIDDGLYFSPQLENRPTPETVHAWVVESASTYKTVDPIIDKKRCVRIPFKAGYHVDIPIYDLITLNAEQNRPLLAIKEDGWNFSDPRAITNWFKSRVADTNSQLRRLVRYFKAWADFQNISSSYKMPSGLFLTILAADEFQYSETDDTAFSKVAASIYDRLMLCETVQNPTDRDEDLRNRISDPQFENFLKRLNILIQHAETALEIESAKEAAEKHWVRLFGNRFPVFDDENNKNSKKTNAIGSPGLIGVASTSASDSY